MNLILVAVDFSISSQVNLQLSVTLMFFETTMSPPLQTVARKVSP